MCLLTLSNIWGRVIVLKQTEKILFNTSSSAQMVKAYYVEKFKRIVSNN